MDSYPPETSLFLKSNNDRFKNPAGSLIKKSLETLASFALEGSDPDTVTRALTDILSLRALQDFSPSDAVGFIPALRGIVREEAGEAAAAQIGPRIDEMLLMAFDVYMERREKIFLLRARELSHRAEAGQ